MSIPGLAETFAYDMDTAFAQKVGEHPGDVILSAEQQFLFVHMSDSFADVARRVTEVPGVENRAVQAQAVAFRCGSVVTEWAYLGAEGCTSNHSRGASRVASIEQRVLNRANNTGLPRYYDALQPQDVLGAIEGDARDVTKVHPELMLIISAVSGHYMSRLGKHPEEARFQLARHASAGITYAAFKIDEAYTRERTTGTSTTDVGSRRAISGEEIAAALAARDLRELLHIAPQATKLP